MANKVIQAVVNNFQRGDVAPVEEPTISRAEAAGLKPPALSEQEMAGVGVEAALANRYTQDLHAFEKYQQEKAAYQKRADDALYAQIRARPTV